MICNFCPRKCNVDRATKTGYCGVGEKIKIARAAPHYWEEPCLSGKNGSGTVFFSGCNLGCIFCQNQDISHRAFGKEVTEDELLKIFDNLLSKGVHNLNLVTPSHYINQIASALEKFKSPVPVIYNTSSYESVEELKKLEGLVDIYLPDLKYYDSEKSLKYSKAADYFEKASQAVLEMYRQAGDLVISENGMAKSGMIIRHLVLPGNISQTEKIFEWVSENLPLETHISLMRQYTPFGKALETPPLNRAVTGREYKIAKDKLYNLGFYNIFFQQKESISESFIPEFDLEGVDIF